MAIKRKLKLGNEKSSPISPKQVDAANKRKLNKCLKSYNDAKDAIVRLQETMQESIKEAQAIMEAQGVRFYVNGPDVAEYEQQKGRASSVIDIRKFYEIVPDMDDFLDAVSVTKKNAQKLLSGAELEKVTTTIPAKEKEPIFVIHRKQ